MSTRPLNDPDGTIIEEDNVFAEKVDEEKDLLDDDDEEEVDEDDDDDEHEDVDDDDEWICVIYYDVLSDDKIINLFILMIYFVNFIPILHKKNECFDCEEMWNVCNCNFF